jgi:hypothetical protein
MSPAEAGRLPLRQSEDHVRGIPFPVLAIVGGRIQTPMIALQSSCHGNTARDQSPNWRHAPEIPLREYAQLVAAGLRNTGSENYGGPVVTKGRTFIYRRNRHDRKFHAFDKLTVSSCGRLCFLPPAMRIQRCRRLTDTGVCCNCRYTHCETAVTAASEARQIICRRHGDCHEKIHR